MTQPRFFARQTATAIILAALVLLLMAACKIQNIEGFCLGQPMRSEGGMPGGIRAIEKQEIWLKVQLVLLPEEQMAIPDGLARPC